MIGSIATDRRANLIGGAWMIAPMAAFAVEDTLVKAASEVLPVGQILIFFGLGGAAIFASIILINKGALFVAEALSRPMRVRVFF